MVGSQWPAAGLWARSVLRRDGRALIALGILAGVTGALALSAFAGARRTDTSLERLRTATRAADAVVFASQAGIPNPDWSDLRARPGIADLAVWDLMFGYQDGKPEGGLLFVSHDGVWGDRMTRPNVTEGRLWSPTASDEVIVTPLIAPLLPIGSTFTFQPYGADQFDFGTAPTGPVVTMHVVGVGTTVNQFLFTPEQIFVGPGFAAEYGDQVFLAQNADVRLQNGSADIAALQRDVNELVAPGTPLLDLNAVSRRVDTSIGVERTALLAMAGVVAVAGGLLVAQALGRSAGRIGEDAPTLRALGMSRRDMIVATVSTHGVVAAVAAMVTAGGAILASQLFPVGLGRQIDPSIGIHADPVVIVPGTLLVAVLVLAGSAVAARRASGTTSRQALRPSVVASAIRAVSPASVGVGAAMALEPGVGRSRVAVRPALLGAVIGVIGVVGTLTIEHSVTDALAHPERAGVTWDARIDPFPSDYGPQGLDPELLALVASSAPTDTGISEMARLGLEVSGVGVPTLTLVPYGSGPAPELTVIAGRSPVRDTEAAIGPKTASDLGVGVGDIVKIGASMTPVTIVGEALFPSDVHSEFDEGLWLTPHEFERVGPPFDEANPYTGPERVILLDFSSNVDATTAIADIDQELMGSVQGVSPAEVPVELTNLSNIHSLPLVLAIFLALLALAAVSHVLVSSSHRRGHDFAVLRAIGLTRRSSWWVVNAQATTIAIVGLLFGIPLGIVAGRFSWRLVAGRVPLQDVGPVPALALVLVIPATLVALNVLALWPGRSVARLRPAELLHEE